MIIESIYAIGALILISLISFIGLLTLSMSDKILKKILLYLVSLSAGALIGDAFLHLIPEATQSGFTIPIALYILSGMVVFFVIEGVIHWHHCHSHDCHHKHDHRFKAKSPKVFIWTNLIGDGIHNFIDGVIIAGSFLASAPLGIATTIAVIFHEIPQEVADFGVLLHGGLSKSKALWYNFLSALTAILGGVLVLAFNKLYGIVDILIPFAAGSFIYIAAADLIPELHHETSGKKKLIQFVFFLIGIGLMIALLFLE